MGSYQTCSPQCSLSFQKFLLFFFFVVFCCNSNCNINAYLSKHTACLHQMNNFASGRSGVLYMTIWLTEHVITAVYHSSQQKIWRKIFTFGHIWINVKQRGTDLYSARCVTKLCNMHYIMKLHNSRYEWGRLNMHIV